METYQEEQCLEPLPQGVEIYRTHFTGSAAAMCNACDFVSVLWDCACELYHDCEANK